QADETARLHCCGQRCRSMAARCAGAAAGYTGDRVSRRRATRNRRAWAGRVQRGPERDRLCRRPKRQRSAKTTTTTIPIVFTVGGDPIKMGLVDSLNRPGGNITGVSFLSSDIVTKMLEALHELLPKGERIAALVNPTNQNAAVDTNEAEVAARAL